MSLSVVHQFGNAVVLIAAIILAGSPCELRAQQSLRRPDLIPLPPSPVGDKHVRSIQLINIPEATTGGAQAAIASHQSIYVAGKEWNEKDSQEKLWLWRVDASGEKLWEKRLALQKTSEEMKIVGLLPGAHTFSQGTGEDHGLRVVFRQGMETRLTFFKSSGHAILEKTVGALESTQGLFAADNDQTLLFGQSMGVQDQPSHAWLARMTRSGTILWKHTLALDVALQFAEAPPRSGRMRLTLPMDGTLLDDGSVLLVGQTGVYNKFAQGPSKLWLLRLDGNGKKLGETFIDDGRGSGQQLIAKSGDGVIVSYTTDQLPPISEVRFNVPFTGFRVNLARFDDRLEKLWDKSLSTGAMPSGAMITGPDPFVSLTAVSDGLLVRALDDQGDELWSSHVATPKASIQPVAALSMDDEIVAVCNYRITGELKEQVLLVFVKPPGSP